MTRVERRSRSLPGQFLRFTGVGAIGTAAHYALMILLVELARANEITASTAGATLGALVNYALNRRFTFRSEKRHVEALSKFLTIAAIGLCLNSVLMFLFLESADVHYLPAQVMTTGLVLVWNFAGNRYWTFRNAG